MGVPPLMETAMYYRVYTGFVTPSYAGWYQGCVEMYRSLVSRFRPGVATVDGPAKSCTTKLGWWKTLKNPISQYFGVISHHLLVISHPLWLVLWRRNWLRIATYRIRWPIQQMLTPGHQGRATLWRSCSRQATLNLLGYQILSADKCVELRLTHGAGFYDVTM